MPRLYVANITKQHNVFCFRIPENPKIFEKTIQSGQQVDVMGDITSPVIDSILEQHSAYGLVDQKNVGRGSGFKGLCYSIGKPVDITAIETGIQASINAAEERSESALRNEILATGEVLTGQISKATRKRSRGRPTIGVFETDERGVRGKPVIMAQPAEGE